MIEGLCLFHEFYRMQYVAARSTKNESAASIDLYDDVLDHVASHYADLAGDAYCGFIGNDVASCVCGDATWYPAVAKTPHFIKLAKSATRIYQGLAEALFQLIRGLKSFKAVFAIAASYVPSGRYFHVSC